jgi:two-component system NtrC family sensor kinase
MPMKKKNEATLSLIHRRPLDSRLDFSQHLLQLATRDSPKAEFFSHVLKLVLEYCGCDAVELWVDDDYLFRYEASTDSKNKFNFKILTDIAKRDSDGSLRTDVWRNIEKICLSLLNEQPNHETSSYTKYGSFWTKDFHEITSWDIEPSSKAMEEEVRISGRYRSLTLTPLRFGKEQIGVILFKNRQKNQYDLEKVEYFETIAAKIELAILYQHSQAKLHERAKEFACLYSIEKMASDPDMTFEHKLMNIVKLLPPAWQYPARACARIILDGKTFKTSDFKEGRYKQVAQISITDKIRGTIEVHYAADPSFSLQEQPFLEEEQRLLDNIGGQIALMIQHKETNEIRRNLQHQLIRADRLAAIGQVAAGVAHELNEPLNAILGFSQLLQKTDGLQKTALDDIKKITDASLHARNIIRELLIFARQSAADRIPVDLNRIIEDELTLFESLCEKSGIEIERVLEPNLPWIIADKSQILQVLSNLIVNALQAMPDGGVLTIETDSDPEFLSLIVADTGIGMSEEVKENIFIPFFTTKDVDQGTGLGLAVVHGIVTSHGGEIHAESRIGQGTRFLITLPRIQDTAQEGTEGNGEA